MWGDRFSLDRGCVGTFVGVLGMPFPDDDQAVPLLPRATSNLGSGAPGLPASAELLLAALWVGVTEAPPPTGTLVPPCPTLMKRAAPGP